MYEQ